MAKFKCDHCDSWVAKVTKQFGRKQKLIYQTCDECSEAIVNREEKIRIACEDIEKQIQGNNDERI